jgi:phosphatidylglycerophosphatase A
VGYFPLAPGTAGSAVGVGLVAALGALALPRPWFRVLLIFVVLGIFLLGAWAATAAEKFFGKTDPGQVVVDEVAGQVLTLIAQPDVSWKWLLIGFVMFRAFDVIKPFPARQAERLPGGWGIMMDDVFAGVYGAVALAVLAHWLR